MCKNKCNSYEGTNLLSAPGKVYGKILIERMHKINKGKSGEEQEGIRMVTTCVCRSDLNICIVIKKMLAKGRKVYAAYIDFEKAFKWIH